MCSMRHAVRRATWHATWRVTWRATWRAVQPGTARAARIAQLLWSRLTRTRKRRIGKFRIGSFQDTCAPRHLEDCVVPVFATTQRCDLRLAQPKPAHARCLLSAACRRLHVACRRLHVVCRRLHVACRRLHVACRRLHVVCRLFACRISHAVCHTIDTPPARAVRAGGHKRDTGGRALPAASCSRSSGFRYE